MTCRYDFSVHFSPSAKQYHTDKCISEWMGKMSDAEGCVEYMSAISRTDADMQGCTVADIEKICQTEKEEFSVYDARQLCTKLNEAHSEFWSQRHAPQHANGLPGIDSIPGMSSMHSFAVDKHT